MTKKRKIYVAVSWVLVLACMGVIFYMSSAGGEESAEMSNSLIQRIFELTGLNISSFVIRKLAHFCEFAGLALLITNAVFASFESKKSTVVAFFGTCIYAAGDEIHQIFSDGRACQIRDILIDCSGALLGVAVAYFIILLYKKHIERNTRYGNS